MPVLAQDGEAASPNLAADIQIDENELDFLVFQGQWTAVTGSCAGPIEVRTQADADGLAGCEAIQGDLTIGPSSVVLDLSPLSSITRITGNLLVTDTGLTSLDGLQGLTSIGGSLSVPRNRILVSLDGLQSLTSVGGNLIIGSWYWDWGMVSYYRVCDGNARLQDISALENLTHVGRTSHIICNPELDCSMFALPFFPVDQSFGNGVDCPAGATVEPTVWVTDTPTVTPTGNQTAAPTPTPIPVEMVTIPAGSFMMGNTGSSRDQDCRCGAVYGGCECQEPRHEVTFNYRFEMGRYEVTNAQYADVLNWAKGRGHLQSTSGGAYEGWNVHHNGQLLLGVSDSDCFIKYSGEQFYVETRNNEVQDSHPVNVVSWHGAVAFCNWASERESLPVCYDLSGWSLTDPQSGGYRLPSESEWEYACRGSVFNPNRYAPFSFGDDTSVDLTTCDYSPLFNQHIVWCGNSGGWSDGWTDEVGSKMPNDYGLYDMHGNLWEWCQDCWHWTYSGAPADGNAWETQTSGECYRVIRGGSWRGDAKDCLSAQRVRYDDRYPDAVKSVGFRIARWAGDLTQLTPTQTPTPTSPQPPCDSGYYLLDSFGGRHRLETHTSSPVRCTSGNPSLVTWNVLSAIRLGRQVRIWWCSMATAEPIS